MNNSSLLKAALDADKLFIFLAILLFGCNASRHASPDPSNDHDIYYGFSKSIIELFKDEFVDLSVLVELKSERPARSPAAT